jgi:hypothetical protein
MLWRLPWLNNSKNRYGDQFLGVYLYDEPGGIYIDYNWTIEEILPRNATFADLSHDSIANLYNHGFQVFDDGFRNAKEYSDKIFVSDYALY